jgi:hypothetical protein
MSNKNPEVAVDSICGPFIYLFTAFKFRIFAHSAPEITLKQRMPVEVGPIQIRIHDLRPNGVSKVQFLNQRGKIKIAGESTNANLNPHS